MTTGTTIFASQFVAIQDKAQSLLGTGSGTRGYGQTVLSSDVFVGNAITKAQWDALRYDIINIKIHQDGFSPSIVQVNSGDVVSYGPSSPNNNYDLILEQAIANRFAVAGSQSIVTAKASQTYSTAWSTQAQAVLTCTFSNATEARYFFNSGGQIRFSGNISGGSSTSQVNAWKNFLSNVGTRSFGASTDSAEVNFYNLTTAYQIYYTGFLSTPYSANQLRLEAKCDVADNSAGTATQVQIRITLLDSYVDPDTFNPGPPTFAPPDQVDGTLTFSIQELKAAGNLQPSGTFSITGPTYSLSSITAS
jgi:hypothetical protein